MQRKLDDDRQPVVKIAGTIVPEGFLDYHRLTGLQLRQLPKALREPDSTVGSVTTAAYAFGLPELAADPRHCIIGTQAKIAEFFDMKPRRFRDWINAGSLSCVHQFQTLYAVHYDTIEATAQVLESMRSDSQRQKIAGTARDGNGKFTTSLSASLTTPSTPK